MTEVVSTITAPSPPRSNAAKQLSILEAATLVFCRDGFASASIETIAAAAQVSRQTIYNHYADKEKLFTAVVKDMTERANAGLFATIAGFPDRPADLEAELVDFATKLATNCQCNRDCFMLRKLIQTEGDRYPELFEPWRLLGPERAWTAIGARFARLHHLGYLDIDDPDTAARQFQALVNADLYIGVLLGDRPTEAEIRAAAVAAVRTFLRAYGKTAAKL